MSERSRANYTIVPLIGVILFTLLIQIPKSRTLYDYEIALSLDWSDSTYYQGEVGNITITLYSTCNNEINITWIGIRFDWMRESDYFQLDLENNPVRISSQGSYEFKPIFFLITLNASVGWNEYYILIHFEEHHSHLGAEEIWSSETEHIYIHDAYEKTYNYNLNDFRSDLISAKDCCFESPYAASTLNQAEDEFNLSRSLAEQGKWQYACIHITTSANLVEQAYSYELIHWKTKVENVIDGAQEGMEDLVELWSPGAKKNLKKAQNKCDTAKIEYEMGSILSLKRAFNYAQESITLSRQAKFNENNFRYLIILGTAGIGITVPLMVFARVRKWGKKRLVGN